MSSPAEDPHQGHSELCAEDMDPWVSISLSLSVRGVNLGILLNFPESPVSHLSTEAKASNEVI